VFFVSGTSYRYDEVPVTLVMEFLLSDSKGKFLHAKIKDKFPTTRL
jgi:hypothetical protein